MSSNAACRGRERRRRSESEAVATVLLAAIERLVGAAEEIGRELSRLGDGAAERCCQLNAGPVGEQGMAGADQGSDALGQVGESLGAIHRRDHGELLTTNPGHEVVLANGRCQSAGDGLQRAVAAGMAVRVVDLLEPVDVENQHGEPAPARGEVHRREGELAIERAAIRDLRQGVDLGEPLELLEPASQVLALAAILKGLYRADDVPRRIAQRRGPDLHRQAAPRLVPEIDQGLAGVAVSHGGDQRAALLTEAAAGGVDVVEQVVEAVPADHLLARVAGEPGGGRVPVDDLALLVHDIEAVVEVVENLVLEDAVGVEELAFPEVVAGHGLGMCRAPAMARSPRRGSTP